MPIRRYNATMRFALPMPSPMMRRSPAIVALLCACATIACAEESSDPFSTEANQTHRPALQGGDPCANAKPDRPLDLFGIVNVALCNNPQTREVWANSRAASAQVGVSQASYLPSASVSLAHNRNSPGLTQRSIGLGLSYLLYDFGARAANLENARQLLASVNATQDSTVQSLFLSAVQNYYQVRATQAALDASIVSEAAAKESYTAANARYLAGSATPADKLTAQTAYSQATLSRITADGALKIAQGNLSNLLGLDANLGTQLAPTEGAASVAELRDFERNVSDLIEQARINRPDLQAAQAQLLAAKAAADAARAAAKPSLSLTASTNQVSGGGVTSQGTTVGISLSAPLFSGYAPTYRIRAAEAQIETRQAQFDRIRLQVALDVWTAYQNLVTAMQNLRATSDLLESAQQSERVALGRYKAGAGIMLDLLNAQTALAAARQQRIQAELNWNIGRATLAQAMGTLGAQTLQSGGASDAEQTPTKNSR